MLTEFDEHNVGNITFYPRCLHLKRLFIKKEKETLNKYMLKYTRIICPRIGTSLSSPQTTEAPRPRKLNTMSNWLSLSSSSSCMLFSFLLINLTPLFVSLNECMKWTLYKYSCSNYSFHFELMFRNCYFSLKYFIKRRTSIHIVVAKYPYL